MDDSFVVVVYRYREGPLCSLLTHDIPVQIGLDLFGGRHILEELLVMEMLLLIEDGVAYLDALITYIDTGSRDQATDFIRVLTAE
jgi:hypothetical protein